MDLACASETVKQAAQALVQAIRAQFCFFGPTLFLPSFEHKSLVTMGFVHVPQLVAQWIKVVVLAIFDIANKPRIWSDTLERMVDWVSSTDGNFSGEPSLRYIFGFDARPLGNRMNIAINIQGDEPTTITTSKKIATIFKGILETDLTVAAFPCLLKCLFDFARIKPLAFGSLPFFQRKVQGGFVAVGGKPIRQHPTMIQNTNHATNLAT